MRWIAAATLAAALATAPAAPAFAQGNDKGHGGAHGGGNAAAHAQGGQQEKARGQQGGAQQGKAHAQQGGAQKQNPQARGQGQAQRGTADKARGNAGANASSGRGNAAARGGRGSAMSAGRGAAKLPHGLAAARPAQRLVGGALLRRQEHGKRAEDLDVRTVGNRVQVLGRDGRVILDMDEDEAGRLGEWRVRRTDDVTGNAPAFCRSGAGHPVWGREWCIQKGFGLGRANDYVWGRSPVDDVVYRDPRYETRSVTSDILSRVLGQVVFGRLALQALSLGAEEPLAGTWYYEQSGPRILRVNAGPVPVAELIDIDRDNEVDVLYVPVAAY